MRNLLARAWKGIRAAALLPSGLGGAFLGLTLFQLGEGSNRLAGLLVGFLYGVATGGLMRVFPVSPGWYWLAGIFAGPIPFALLMPGDTPAQERGVIYLGAVLGGLLGLLETAHWRRSKGVRDHAVPIQVVPPDPGPPR